MARHPLATLSSGPLPPQPEHRWSVGLCEKHKSARRAFLHILEKKKQAGENKQTLTHLRSSCHRWISGNLRCTSTRRSPGCSRRSGHTGGPGSASTRLHLRGQRKKKKKASVIAFFIYLFIFFLCLCTGACECASAITLGSSAENVMREEHLQVHCDERRPGRSEGPCVTMGWGTCDCPVDALTLLCGLFLY